MSGYRVYYAHFTLDADLADMAGPDETSLVRFITQEMEAYAHALARVIVAERNGLEFHADKNVGIAIVEAPDDDVDGEPWRG